MRFLRLRKMPTTAIEPVGYVAGAALQGITLERLEVETSGSLDLRGFLGIDPAVLPGYHTIRYTVRLKGDGTPAQFEAIHETGDVRAVHQQTPAKFDLRQPRRRAQQEIQNIELARAEIPAVEQHATRIPDGIGGGEQLEEGVIARTRAGPPGFHA